MRLQSSRTKGKGKLSDSGPIVNFFGKPSSQVFDEYMYFPNSFFLQDKSR